MKKNGIIIGCVMALVFSTTAYCGEGLYGKVSLGTAIPLDSDIEQSGRSMETEQDDGVALGAALGYDFGHIRVEGELAHQTNDFSELKFHGNRYDLVGKTRITAFLVNGYYDFTNKTPFTPYVSAGLGCAKIEVKDLNFNGVTNPAINDDELVLAYQAGAGVEYAVTETIALDLKYRFFGMADPEFDHTEAEFRSQNLYFGVRFNL